MSICSVPGCKAKVSTQNVATVCLRHQHKPGYCKCAPCIRKGKPAVGITLPKAPWEARNDKNA